VCRLLLTSTSRFLPIPRLARTSRPLVRSPLIFLVDALRANEVLVANAAAAKTVLSHIVFLLSILLFLPTGIFLPTTSLLLRCHRALDPGMGTRCPLSLPPLCCLFFAFSLNMTPCQFFSPRTSASINSFPFSLPPLISPRKHFSGPPKSL